MMDEERYYEGGEPETYHKDGRILIFFRAEGWYTLFVPFKDDIGDYAQRNPGTKRVEDFEGNVVWQVQ